MVHDFWIKKENKEVFISEGKWNIILKISNYFLFLL